MTESEYDKLVEQYLFYYETYLSAYSYWEGYKKEGKGVVIVVYPIKSERGDRGYEVSYKKLTEYKKLTMPYTKSCLEQVVLNCLDYNPETTFLVHFGHPVYGYNHPDHRIPRQAPKDTIPAQMMEFVT
jgi:hypothetical protein